MTGLPYVKMLQGGDVDSPVALRLLEDLDGWDDAPLSLRQHLVAYRDALMADAEAWACRHDESRELDQAREDFAECEQRLEEYEHRLEDLGEVSLVGTYLDFGDVAEVRARVRHLAREVAAIPPYLEGEFTTLLAEERGD